MKNQKNNTDSIVLIYSHIFSNEFYFSGELTQNSIINNHFERVFKLNKTTMALEKKEIYSQMLEMFINSDYEYDPIKKMIKEGKSN